MSASLVERHIVAMGGGGFSMEPDNPLLVLAVTLSCAAVTLAA